MRVFITICGVAFLVFAHLGPSAWIPRTGLGWQLEHILGYFVVTLIICFAWLRPLVVGITLMASAALLEALQVLTPGRRADFLAAAFGAGGALAAALLVELSIFWMKKTLSSLKGS
jgi:VanZ family protein